MLLTPVIPECRRSDCYKLRDSLVYKVSSRWPGLQSETLSPNNKQNKSDEVWEAKLSPEQLGNLPTARRLRESDPGIN